MRWLTLLQALFRLLQEKDEGQQLTTAQLRDALAGPALSASRLSSRSHLISKHRLLNTLRLMRPELARMLLDESTKDLLAKQVAFSFDEVHAAISNANPPSFSWDELLDLLMHIR